MRIQLRLNEAGLGIACQLCFFSALFCLFFCALQKLLILNGTNVCDAAEESGRLLISQCENSCLSWFHCDCRNPEGAGEEDRCFPSRVRSEIRRRAVEVDLIHHN